MHFFEGKKNGKMTSLRAGDSAIVRLKKASHYSILYRSRNGSFFSKFSTLLGTHEHKAFAQRRKIARENRSIPMSYVLQAFVVLEHVATGHEAVFVATAQADGVHLAEIVSRSVIHRQVEIENPKEHAIV